LEREWEWAMSLNLGEKKMMNMDRVDHLVNRRVWMVLTNRLTLLEAVDIIHNTTRMT
jgi:flagellar biosynthesis regulator FlbT